MGRVEPPRVVVEVRPPPDPARIRAEVLGLLGRRPRELSPKYFYDDAGSALFEEICGLPEYYLTRAEGEILAREADRIASLSGARELLELGSGAATKTRLLLGGLDRAGRLERYLPIDLNEGMIRRSAAELVARHPGLRVHGIAGDFLDELGRLPPGRDRLVAYLGSSLGNFRPAESREFAARLAAATRPGDSFLLGVDLAKDPAVLEAAYDDAAGVTARFNLNILLAMNRMLGGDFDPAGFRHRALYDRDNRWIEMRLVALRPMRVRLPELPLEFELAAGEELLTEISAKYDRPGVEALLSGAGFEPLEWFTDSAGRFALSLSRRR